MPRICAISDTHSYHRDIKIPDCDVLIVAGDISFHGELNVIEDFSNWLKELPIKEKIVCMGNHEENCEEPGPHRDAAINFITNSGARYLEDSGIEIDGTKYWASPVSLFFFDWAFNRHPHEIGKHWDLIPNDTNVMISHGPPYGFGDRTVHGENVGCKLLLKKLKSLPNLKLAVSGHIHNNYGHRRWGDTHFVNASICTEKYQPINKPIVIDI